MAPPRGRGAPPPAGRARASRPISLDLKLNDETLKKLDAIWPGPGGTAPEAYAW